MTNSSFLDKLSVELLNQYGSKIADVIVVLPNKRAKLFFFEALQRHASGSIFAPQVISIEEFIQEIAQIRTIDSIELILEFYNVYLNITEPAKQQSFESVANWAKMLIQDFNEIDRYLLEPSKVLSYLKSIEDIKHWSLDIEAHTDLIKSHLLFWELLPTYYKKFYEYLRSKKIGYQGLIYREAESNIVPFLTSIGTRKYVFAGFNALNVAEEKIIQHMLSNGNAEVFWDIDNVFLSDPFHDAGLFIRRIKNNWKYYNSNQFNWVSNDFSEPKNIKIIGTSKMIGQAKIVGKIIEEQINSNPELSLDKVAIVLAEESLLMPLLYSLPEETGPVNITMGYSAKNNPAQILIAKLFKMHVSALKRDANRYVFYYKDLLDILNHPLVEPHADARDLERIIQTQNYTFIPFTKIQELHPNQNAFFKLLFTKWDSDASQVLSLLTEIILQLKAKLSDDNNEDKILKTFVYAIYKVVNKLSNYFSRHPEVNNVEVLQNMYKQVIDLAEVSFEGEPLKGLQIMGVLESRVLDFDTVIITSVNEGKFPAGKSTNSFIPYDVKKELGLPTFKEKDAIYTYHFYHLLQRAKNIYLLYNTESEGLNAGEKSRFITQLLVEKQPNHSITTEIYNPTLPQQSYTPVIIPKSDAVMMRLKEIAEKGFSPTAFTGYIRNPIDFYYSRILRLKEFEEVEENIALNTMGTVIHEALHELYKPFKGEVLNEENIQQCRTRIDEEVLKQFKLIYKEGEIKKGKNLLAFEVAKRNIFNFLRMESESLRDGDVIRILELERSSEIVLNHPNLQFPVKIRGSVDRIEERNGVVRIIDYKSGKVTKDNLQLKTWDNLTLDIKNEKIIQILAYAIMLRPIYADKKLQAGIISFKNIRGGFMPFTFVNGKERNEYIDAGVFEDFENQLVELINKLLDKDIPFEEK